MTSNKDVTAVQQHISTSKSTKKLAPDGTEVDNAFFNDLCPSNGCANTQYAIPKLD